MVEVGVVRCQKVFFSVGEGFCYGQMGMKIDCWSCTYRKVDAAVIDNCVALSTFNQVELGAPEVGPVITYHSA